MRTKEEILESMREAMPFHLSHNIKPYILEAMEIYAQEKVKNCSMSDVSDCTTRDWVITYTDSDGCIQKAVISGKDDDEAIANFRRDYHQEWRTVKAIV